MIYSPNFIVVLDACVLYPAPLRDLLLSCAEAGLYKPKWSSEIQNEWTRKLLLNRPDLTPRQLESTIRAMNLAFPDANIIDYEKLIKAIHLPDANDRHVLAAAIRSKADVIATFNLKDFPGDILSEFDIESQHPDVVLSNLFDLNKARFIQAFNSQVNRLIFPPKTTNEVLHSLKKSGLNSVVEKIKGAI
jgi:predicted nucleic acid-binding protein